MIDKAGVNLLIVQEPCTRLNFAWIAMQSMNALSEMNMTNLAKMSGRLPVALQALQVKWRDEAQRIRGKGRCPSLKELVEFIERRVRQPMTPYLAKLVK